MITNYIRGIVRKHPELKTKLRTAASKQTPFQYVYQSITMTIFSAIATFILVYMIFNSNIINLLIGFGISLVIIPFYFKFWMSYVDVQIRKESRELDRDLLFVSEFFLVSLESGLPLGNAIKNISKLKRPGAKFFKKIYTEFNTGKDLEQAIEEGSNYCASADMKILLKRLKDSMNIGIDLRSVLINFINESAEKKIIEIRGFSKKLNPLVMMYLLMGIVLPSLGVTFFMLGAALSQMTPDFLQIILILVFLIMFGFQYMSYSIFKFSKSTI